MALMGADILVLITNTPTYDMDKRIITHTVIARAIENTVNVVTSNRVGNEKGTTFCGMSKIVNTTGEIVNCASTDREEIIYGEVSLEKARRKRIIVQPGEYEQNYMADRRPELYDLIRKPTSG
jgi:predicted amidohydrolase